MPSLLVLAVAVWLPGLLFARLWRATWFTAWAIAPAVSGFLISMLAVLVSSVGLDYGPLPLVVLVLLLFLAYATVTLRLRGTPDSPRLVRLGRPSRLTAMVVISIAAGVVVLARSVLEVLGSPQALGQNFDNMFHQNVLRWFVNHRDASPLSIGQISGEGGGFYPALWHQLASLPLLTVGDVETTAATSALILVTCGVWITGCVYLVHTLLPARWVVLVSAGVLAASFPAFPFIPLGWGPLYPNFLAQALLPGALGLLARVLGLGLPQPATSGRPWSGRIVLLATAAGGIALCHPNVLVAGLIIAVPMVGAWVAQDSRPHRPSRRLRMVMFAAYCAGVVGAWRVLRPPEWAVGYWQARHDIWTALVQVVLQNPLTGLPAWPLAVLVLLGAYATLYRRRHRWLLVSHLIVSGLFVVVSAFPGGPLRTALTGVWYNDSPRLAALLPVTAVPLAALGVDLLVRGAYAVGRRLNLNPAARRRGGATAAVLWVVLLAAITQSSGYRAETVDRVGTEYRLTDSSALLTRDELAVIRTVPEHVAVDEVIAVHPWAGGPLVYAYANREPTARHGFHPDTPELAELNQHLREAATRPEVCAAARELDVRFALDFGMREVNGESHPGYDGFRDLAASPGFTEVSRSGEAVLLRLDACR